MSYFSKHPMAMIVVGIIGISLSAIFVRFSTAPSAVTAAFRLLWTVVLMAPVAIGKKSVRREMASLDKKTVLLSFLSGLFLAVHFVTWFESLQHTSVASSTTIVCTEVIWVALGFCLFLGGRLVKGAVRSIAVTLAGSILIALSSSADGPQLYGVLLALFSAVMVAMYTLLGRVVRSGGTSTTVYTFLVYTACAAILAATCMVQGLGLLDYGPSPIIVGLLLSVFSTILGHSIFSWCLKYFSPAFVSASKLCEPVVAALFAAFLFGELPTFLQLVGCVLVLAGVFRYSRLEMKQQRN